MQLRFPVLGGDLNSTDGFHRSAFRCLGKFRQASHRIMVAQRHRRQALFRSQLNQPGRRTSPVGVIRMGMQIAQTLHNTFLSYGNGLLSAEPGVYFNPFNICSAAFFGSSVLTI